ncbi:winged-helix domain-containing protein (plasmid) [Methylocapsa polymorpha]|uniref:Winged-helix domain-containing protein n=1 Tax=Methylocapsa polymorpha TaxID=3080828 RepID=A0ABZ0I145_9HYPH|nr:winged-helix domain-containing protein [Methylocapsa sp. RX1]
MDTVLERIHAKIAELEAKIGDLRIAERELQAIEKTSARQTKTASEPKAKQKPGPKAGRQPKLRGKLEASEPGEARQTIGAAISAVLAEHGPLSAAEIAEQVKATGRDINNRTVSFALQALKKRGLAKNVDGKWAAPKARGRKAASVSTVNADETKAAA